MALDFQQVRQQIHVLVENAPARQEELRNLREQADRLLTKYALDLDNLRDKVSRAATLDRYFRSAIPTQEPLSQTYPLPPLPEKATIIAADGSQINPDRHMGLEYCLVNVGTIQMMLGSPQAPNTTIHSTLYHGENLFTFTEGLVALIRDQREREVLAELAAHAEMPVITFTDGPIQLWERGEVWDQEQHQDDGNPESARPFELYLKALARLQKLGAATAGYVARSHSDLVVRLLELAALDENKLAQATKNHWLQGITDVELFRPLLNHGERTAIFGLQSSSARKYQEDFAIHFFYLNVSLEQDISEVARVEIPAWVAQTPELVNNLHAVLVAQSQVIASARYPYLLQRAHETAVVTHAEREQVDNMIAIELRRRGLDVLEHSSKQKAKDTARMSAKRKETKKL